MSKSFSQLRQELNELALPAPKTTAVAKPTSTSVANIAKPAGEKVIGSGSTSGVMKSLPSPASSLAKTTLKDVGKSALGAAGRLASKAVAPVSALTTGYEVGKSLNNISAVDKVTDKIGKSIAGGLQKIGIGTAPEVVKAKSPEVSRKVADSGPKTSVPTKTGGGTVSFPTTAKPTSPVAAPVKKAMPSPMAKSAPVKSPDFSDINNAKSTANKISDINKSQRDFTKSRFGATPVGKTAQSFSTASSKLSSAQSSAEKAATGMSAASAKLDRLMGIKSSAPSTPSAPKPAVAPSAPKQPVTSSSAAKANPGTGKWM